jgi:hypothetical protein
MILFPRGHRTFYILCFFKYISIGKGFEVISPEKNEDVRNNSWNAGKTCFRNYLQVICHKNNHVRQNTSVPTRRATTIESIFVGNYARSSQLFESGFSGFRGLTITSLVSVEGYYEIVLSFQDFSPMRYASAKKRVKNNSLQMNLMLKPKTSSVIL